MDTPAYDANDPPTIKHAGKLTITPDVDVVWLYTGWLMTLGALALAILVACGRWRTGLVTYAVVGAAREVAHQWDAWRDEGSAMFNRADAIRMTMEGASQRWLEWLQVGLVALAVGAAARWIHRRLARRA